LIKSPDGLSETVTLVEALRLADLTAGTSRAHFARAPGILLFDTSAIRGLREAERRLSQGSPKHHSSGA
jgi:hypothetical protein